MANPMDDMTPEEIARQEELASELAVIQEFLEEMGDLDDY